MVVNTVYGMLECHGIGCKIPFIRKIWHIYIEWQKDRNVLYDNFELRKLHKNFFHPSSEKFFHLLKVARPWETDSGTTEVLEDTTLRWNVCQWFSREPVWFRVLLPSEDKIGFGNELSIKIMYLDGNAVLQIEDTATGFSAAPFLDKQNTKFGQMMEGKWLAFVMTWFLVYSDYPNRLRTDEDSVFTSNSRKQQTDLDKIQVCISGVETHSSFGVDERYQNPSGRFYRKMQNAYSSVPREYLLKLAVKEINDTMGKNGLVPSRLVFWIVSRFPILSTDLPSQKEGLKTSKFAEAKMNSIVVEQRVPDALTGNTPPAADRKYKTGAKVLDFSEVWKNGLVSLKLFVLKDEWWKFITEIET